MIQVNERKALNSEDFNKLFISSLWRFWMTSKSVENQGRSYEENDMKILFHRNLEIFYMNETLRNEDEKRNIMSLGMKELIKRI